MTLPHVHLAQGHTSSGLLKKLRLPGRIHLVPEDLSHGPLDDGRRRMAYMKECCRCLDRDYDPDPQHDDAFWPWHALKAIVHGRNPEAVLVWHAGNVADYILLRMAASVLRDDDVRLEEIRVPPRGRDHAVAIYAPAELAPLFETRRAIEHPERTALADEFLAIQARPELLRRFDGRKLEFLGIDAYDGEILRPCRDAWVPATQVIAQVWSAWGDGRNWPSDIFIAARLSALIDAGRLEAEGDRARIQTYRVRRRGGAEEA